MTALGALLAAAALLAAGAAIGHRLARRARPTYEEGLDCGITHGVAVARRTVAHFAKPYITTSQEQGWDLARRQLVGALDVLARDVAGEQPTDAEIAQVAP